MKHIILLTLLLAFCQVAECQYFSNTDIPELNRKILSYTDSVIGKKIGKGWCREFVIEALRNSSSKHHKIEVKFAKTRKQWGTTVETLQKAFYLKHVFYAFDLINGVLRVPASGDTIYAGDIISTVGHIGIIYKVISPTEYIVAHQNFSGRRKYTQVELTQIDILADKLYILIERPISLHYIGEQKAGLDRY